MSVTDKESIKAIFSHNLRYYMTQSGLSQADLSKLLSVTSASVSDWCNGKKIPRMDKIQIICDILHVQKSDLLEEKTESAMEYRVEAARIALFLEEHPDFSSAFYYMMQLNEEDLPLLTAFLSRLVNDASARRTR